MSKTIITAILLLILLLTAQCLAQDVRSKTAGTASIKAKIIKYKKLKLAVTIRLKPGSVYYYVPRDGEIAHNVDREIKLSGTIGATDEEHFYLNERWFLGQSGLLKIKYEDIAKVRMNLIPNALKTIGEACLYCIVLMPTGACAK
jgi:hypothetical protein